MLETGDDDQLDELQMCRGWDEREKMWGYEGGLQDKLRVEWHMGWHVVQGDG